MGVFHSQSRSPGRQGHQAQTNVNSPWAVAMEVWAVTMESNLSKMNSTLRNKLTTQANHLRSAMIAQITKQELAIILPA